jgi:hypothetical protein
VKFLEQKNLKEESGDVRKCIERMIIKRYIATFVPPVLATYIAREMGTADVGKLIFSLDQVALSGSLTVLFKKRNHLFVRFNTLMRRYLEADLLEMFWTELQH